MNLSGYDFILLTSYVEWENRARTSIQHSHSETNKWWQSQKLKDFLKKLLSELELRWSYKSKLRLWLMKNLQISLQMLCGIKVWVYAEPLKNS